MKIIYQCMFILCFHNVLVPANIVNLDYFNIDNTVKKLGYTLEKYMVITNDGITLELHRLKSPQISTNNDRFKTPVLMVHGLTGSSLDWVITGNSGLASMLVENGYDVWLGNTRSSVYSNLRVKNNDTSLNRWDFSWHEMGLLDVSKIIDKILEITERDKIYYVGYSQGSTEFFVLTSMFPEYNDKIYLMVSLAPAVYTADVDLKHRIIAYVVTYSLQLFTKLFGHFEILITTSLIKLFTSHCVTSKSRIFQTLCILVSIFTFNNEEADISILKKYFWFNPYGGSTKQVLHYAQSVYEPHEFKQYDYGKSTNELIYNSPEPLVYPLENVNAPVYIFHSTKDSVVPVTGVQKLKSRIKNCIGVYKIHKFSHLDFIFGEDRLTLNNKILRVMRTSKFT